MEERLTRQQRKVVALLCNGVGIKRYSSPALPPKIDGAPTLGHDQKNVERA